MLECLLLYLKTEIKTPELLDNPERWVSMVVAVDPVIEQITGTYRDNVQCLSECRLVVHHKKKQYYYNTCTSPLSMHVTSLFYMVYVGNEV